MRDAAVGVGFLVLVALYWAFRTGLHWHEPDKLAAFWMLHGSAIVVGILAWGLWRGLGALYGRLVLRFEKGRALERAHVVAYLRQEAEENLRLSTDPTAEVLRHDLEVAGAVLAEEARNLEKGLHVASRSKP